MRAHAWRSVSLVVAGLAVALVAFGSGAEKASAQVPPGAAQNLTVAGQACTNDGRVVVTFFWQPSGQGTQWFDITRLSNFSAWGNQGPLAASTQSVQWTLDSNRTFYARVNTSTAQGWRTSETLQFQTVNCPGAFSSPRNVQATTLNDFVRVSWQPGSGNSFFCVDTARTEADLLNKGLTWRNWGCGTTSTSLDISGLGCERTYFYRVWATGPAGSGHSETRMLQAQSCNFAPPFNPRADAQADGSVSFSWNRGNNNHFFCVDLAFSERDLRDRSGTWRNAACGTTGTTASVSGLECGREYFYRIWATSSGASGYSPIARVTTAPCAFQPPTGLGTRVPAEDTVRFGWTAQDPALWYCVDIAESRADLTSFTGTWRNFACGTTDTVVDVTDTYFECGETYFWRVFAYAGTRSGHSSIATFVMNCP